MSLAAKIKPQKTIITSETDIINQVPWYIKWATSILTSTNQVPKHIAFIMDGNRRFAKNKNQKVLEGHKAGFEKLADVLVWCRLCKVKEVTVYAFSLENFKRSQSEVDGLMKLFESTFEQIRGDLESARKNRIQIKIVGEIHLLSDNIVKMIEEIHESTRFDENSEVGPSCTMNVCIAYTGRQEIVNALDRATKNGETDDFKKYLDLPPADILIRTSGETRLSDFMLYQTAMEKTRICFVDSLWPDFKFYEFLKCILEWQIFNN